MIFVTVGTHEQQFDRLVKFVDELKKKDVIKEDVIIQIGFSDYIPMCCKWQRLFSYTEMLELVDKASIVITHGGPSSFIMPLQVGKTPIVVPRRKEFGEHVNDHQVMFCHAVEEKQRNIVVIDDIKDLTNAIVNYNDIVLNKSSNLNSNNMKFCESFEKEICELFKSK